MKTKKMSLIARVLILTVLTLVMPFSITSVETQNNPDIVYVVICIDTEMWGSHEPYIGSSDPHPTMDMRAYAHSPPSTISQVFDSVFRNSHLDSFGNNFKMTWFAEMDYLFAQGIFVYENGSSAGVSGYTAVHDILVNNWGAEIQMYGDSIEYHHHFMIYDGTWERYDNGPDEGYPDYHMYALDHMIIDRNFYPSTWRSGWLVMTPVLSNWLEQWIPFDYTPDSGIWYPVHPSYDMNRWQTRCSGPSQEEVNEAFERARDYGSAVYSFYCHDRDDMASAIDWLQYCLDTADANEAMYPNVSFKYASAREAMQSALGFTDFTPPTFTVTASGGTYTITSNEPLWANHPYVALKYTDGTYMHVEATPTGTNTWIVTQPTGAAIETIGVAACDQYGNPGVELVAGVRFESVYHTFSIDPTSHDDYGLAYPATYEFSIPNGVSNMKAYKRFTSEEGWVQIVEKTSNDFFNGIEAVRFDYAENRAYVSISFRSDSNSIYLYFTDSVGNEISTGFIGITEYYDNRRVAVVFTLDDVTAWDPYFESASVAFADAKVWWTAGLITMGPSWQTIQDGVDRGYLEIASHSRNHQSPPYSDYDSEIGGSKEDIITNLDLPYPYKKGNQEYVWCWIEPYGESDDMVQYTLGDYKYLVSRTAYVESLGPTYYEEWNSVYGLFNRATSTICMDWTESTDLNNMFDYVYSLGGIYHAWGHPDQIGWEAGENGYEHIQYVKGKKDVWYVGFGALYAYAYARMRVQSMAVTISPTHVKMYIGQSQTFNCSVSGGTPSYSYQWYLNDSQVPGATGSTWTFTPTSAGNYKVYLWVTDSLNVKAQSNVVRDILVYSQLSVSVSPASMNMTVGESQMFTSNVSGGVPPYSYQWYLNDSQVLGATGSAWMFTPTSAGTYKIYLRVADNYAATAQSNSATARVETPLIVAISPTSVKMYFGQSQTFSSSFSGGTPPYSYQWYLNDTAVSGATSSSWMFTPRSTGNYKVYLWVTDGLNIQALSNVVEDVCVYSVHLFLTVEPNQATYVRGQSVTLTVNVFNQLNPALESTLTLTVTGPNNYYDFDLQPISVPADTIREYSFTWTVPDVAGKYVGEVELVPSQLTAYDAVWLKVR